MTSISQFQKTSTEPMVKKQQQLTLPDTLIICKSDQFPLGRQPTQVGVELERQRLAGISIPTTILVRPTEGGKGHKSHLKLWRKIKKVNRKKNPFEYRKNICGYITKKVIRQFTTNQYLNKVNQLCQKYNCNYGEAKQYYAGKIEHVTGPSHIAGLLVPENAGELEYKLAFREFFQWFLREHYLRYLLTDGKMTDKRAYIQYKNNTLLSMISRTNVKYPIKKEKNICKIEHIQEQYRDGERTAKGQKQKPQQNMIQGKIQQMPTVKIQPELYTQGLGHKNK